MEKLLNDLKCKELSGSDLNLTNYTNNKIYKSTTYKCLKKKSRVLGYTRFFSTSSVKLRAKTFVSLKDLTSNLQAESSADAARRITRNPNPNRIASLVRRIYTIYIESDLETKIDKMNDLLRESF